MVVDITRSGFVVRGLEYSKLDDEEFRARVERALRLVEVEFGLGLEGAFEYDHINKTLRVDFDDDRYLQSSSMERADSLSRVLTEELNGSTPAEAHS